MERNYFSLEINTDNAAFDYPAEETARILRDVADRIERGAEYGRIHDVNGNNVGDFSFNSRGYDYEEG